MYGGPLHEKHKEGYEEASQNENVKTAENADTKARKNMEIAADWLCCDWL